MIDKFDSFVALAKQRYRITITSVEEKLLKAIVAGKVADYQVKSPALDNLAQAKSWGEKRILSAEFIHWLCTDVEAFEYFTNHGLQVCGAKILGKLNLEFVKFESLLYFTQCVFTEKIILGGAKVEEVKFDGSHVVGIDAGLIEVRGNLYLINGFQSKGEVSIAGAIIGGQLACVGGHFSNKEGDALFAESIEVKTSIFLSYGFKAEGRVSLYGAAIGGVLSCSQCHFSNPEKDALIAQSIEVKGPVFLSDDFKAEGRVSLSGAKIGGVLDCSDGHFSNPEKDALFAQSIEVKASVFLSDGFEAEGEVTLSGANIGGQLNCSDSHFSNKEGYALVAQNIEVKTNIILSNGFKAEGAVDLTAANIKGNLDCTNGNFYNEKDNVLSARGINVDGDIILDKATFQGEIYLVSARVDGTLSMLQIKESKQMKLDLQFARIARLKDDEQSWPQQNNLNLDGFIYQKFSTDNNIPKDSKTRYKWLRLQPDFFPQTYEQLAEVFKKEGEPDAAREILIRKKRDIKPKINCLGQFWNCILDVTIVYGYKPAKALFWSSIFILFGVYLFNLGYENCAELISNNKCLFSPSSRILAYIKDEKTKDNKKIDIDYPEFNSFWYSLDTFLPIVDLHQQTYWLPNTKKSGKIPLILFKLKIGEVSGPRLRLYLWIHIACGWILTSLWVAGFSGLVRG